MKSEKFKITLLFLLIAGLVMPNFAFMFSLPETTSDLKGVGDRIIESIQKIIPETFKKLWQEECLPIWQKMFGWCKKTFWDPYLGPFFQREIEKRKPAIEEEFQKEKTEMKESAKEEVPKATKSLWEKLKDLFK